MRDGLTDRSRRNATLLRVSLLAALSTMSVLMVAPSASAYIYWGHQSGVAVGRANNDGTGSTASFTGTGGGSTAVTANTSYVYWTEYANNRIGRANLDGTGQVSNFITGLDYPTGIAIDSQYIYWANRNTDSIGRANLDGTGVDETFIPGARAQALTKSATHLYWASASGSWVGRANIDGTGVNATFIATGMLPWGVAVNGSHVFWSNSQTNTIGRANLDGSGINQSFITTAGWPSGLWVDSSHIYYARYSAWRLGRANLDGTGQNDDFITTGLAAPGDIWIDAGPWAPEVTTTAAALAYEKGDPATAVDPALGLTDIDTTSMASAQVSISTGFTSGQDVLSFTDQNGITGTYDANTGVLTLTGSATIADYRTALRSVTYRNSSGSPSTADRTVSFVVNDGSADSDVATRRIAVSVPTVPTKVTCPAGNSAGVTCTRRSNGGWRIVGTPGRDTIVGVTRGDVLIGRGGRDTIKGGRGSDTIRGGAGDDTLYGGRHADRIFGGSGDDLAWGGAGRDHLHGDAGSDGLDGGAGDDILEGGRGLELYIRGGGGIDTITWE